MLPLRLSTGATVLVIWVMMALPLAAHAGEEQLAVAVGVVLRRLRIVLEIAVGIEHDALAVDRRRPLVLDRRQRVVICIHSCWRRVRAKISVLPSALSPVGSAFDSTTM